VDYEKKIRVYPVSGDFRRLDHFLTGVLGEYSRSDLKRMIADNRVRINGETETRCSRSLKKDDRVSVILYPEKPREISSTTPFCRLYEDAYLLVINKPSGISVHPGAAREERETVLDRLLLEYPHLKRKGADGRPGIVHRLDRGTSGVLILAKREEVVPSLQSSFKQREIHKEYIAIVKGRLRFLHGKIENYLTRDHRDRTRFRVGRGGESRARYALTRYRKIMSRDSVSLVRIFPLTGRTHQIRVHMKHIGHPVLGDEKYGERTARFSRMALHAYTIEFTHPIYGHKLNITARIPGEFLQYMRELSNPV
jgi:23S rRNA pseudouridine1911/1915/1917 synthase